MCKKKPVTSLKKPVDTLSIPNPMCGEAYSFSVKEQLGTEDILSEKYSDDEGDLHLQEEESGRFIAGKPSKSREWWVEVELTDKVIRFNCFINADPRQMWEDIPSDQLVKPDKYYRALLTPTVDIIGVSHRGRSHANKGAYRDDDFYFDLVGNIAISVVADGAGSAEFSSIGSKVFSKAAGEKLSELLVEKKSKLMELLYDVQHHSQNQLFRPDFVACLYEILPAAALYGRKQLQVLAEQNQLPVKKYHTTALLSFSLPLSQEIYFCAAFQIGDGITVAFHDDEVEMLGKADTGSAPGETAFVTSDGVFDNATDLMKRIHICFTSFKPIVISMTDGITDSYFKESMSVGDGHLWKQFIAEIQTHDGVFKPASEICEWLNYYIPQEHDDRTMTVVHYK